MVGIQVCQIHGGKSPQVLRKHQRAVIHEGLKKLISPIEADDPEADPIFSFEMEFRRTIARIRYFDEKIAELPSEHDLVWGLTKEEEIDATEFGGVNRIYESGLNAYYEAQFRERQHLTDMHKLWIAAKLDAKKLEIEQSIMDRLEAVITAVIVGLGRSPSDPEVRLTVRNSMLPVAGQVTSR